MNCSQTTTERLASSLANHGLVRLPLLKRREVSAAGRWVNRGADDEWVKSEGDNRSGGGFTVHSERGFLTARGPYSLNYLQGWGC